MNNINWSTEYLPGKTDNFVSNEVIVDKLKIENIWNNLVDTAKWEMYYDNASNVNLSIKNDTKLHFAETFHFDTFGFPIDAQVMELVEPTDSKVARLAWHGWQDGDVGQRFDVYHAFLIEQLDDRRIRLLTQESQIGKPAVELAKQRPNPMLNGHQKWLDGLIDYTRNQELEDLNN